MVGLLPGFEANGSLLPFVVVAVAMVLVTVVVLGLVLATDRRPPLLTQMLLALAVVGGGSLLLLALVFAFVNPNGTDAWTWVLMAFNFMMAVPVGIWFVMLVVYRDRRVRPGGWAWPLGLAVATTGTEVLMGVLFAVGGSSDARTDVSALADGLSSVWFFWSMAAVMAGLVVWARLAPSERAVARGLLLAAVVAPWVGAYPTVGGAATALVMAAVVVTVLRRLSLRRVDPSEAGFLVAVSLAFVAMTVAGFALAADRGGASARIGFGAVMGVVMTGEIAFLVRHCYATPTLEPLPRAAAAPTAGTGPSRS